MIGFLIDLLDKFLDMFLNLISMVGPVALTLTVLLNVIPMSRLGMLSLLILSTVM